MRLAGLVPSAILNGDMSKKCPRTPDLLADSKLASEYWINRLFQNTFTYRGQRRTVRRWSVKIQFQGRRKTFSLQSARRSTASQEACRLYRHLVESGWNAFEQVPVQRGLATPNSYGCNRYGYWRQHLVHRDYTAELHSDRT